MSQIFKDLKPYAKNNRNVFDLTRTSTFSSKSGMIQPCFIQETVPDGKYKIDVNGIIRTLPMQTANFTTLKANMEFFFVPYSQLWHYFNQFYYGRGDQHRTPSGAITLDNQPTSTPNFDYRRVCLELCSASIQQLYYDFMIKYINYLDTFDAMSMFTDLDDPLKIPTARAYFNRYRSNLHLFVDAMVKEYVDYQLPSDIMSIRNIHFADVHGRMCAIDMVRMFDLLGYGNLLPFIKLYWTQIYEFGHFDRLYQATYGFDTTTNRLTITADMQVYPGDVDTLINIFVSNIYDLDLPDTDPTAAADSAASGLSTDIYNRVQVGFNTYLPPLLNFIPAVSPNPFRVMAFFKIWNDFYRNAQYDNLPYHTLFNADYITGSSTNNFEYTRFLRMLVPNYHQYKKDRFTGSYPDSQFGDVAVAGLGNPTTLDYNGDWPEGSSTSVNLGLQVNHDDGGLYPYQEVQGTVKFGSNNWYIDTGVSVLAIRQAEALQRWKEKILRAGNREKDLQDAIFGVKSKYIEDGYVDFLGSCDGTINVNPVAATASTDSAEIGELGAFAVGNISGKEIEYDAKDFGIIMGVLYVMPETKYDAFGLDPFNSKTLPDDYYKPDFQNLGLAPVYSSDFNIFNLIETVDGVEQSNIKVLGYLSRYYEYKTSLNKVHGEFFGSNPVLNALQRGMIAGLDISGNLENLQNILANCSAGVDSSLVSVRDVRDFEAMTLSALYCNPDDVNSLFYQASDPGLWSDQFKYEVQFTTKAILPMSVDGLPY